MDQQVTIEHRLTEVESRSKSNTKRLDEFEKRHTERLDEVEKRHTKRLDEVEKRQDNLDDLVSTVKVLAVREENVESDVKEIKSDVKTLTGVPAKRWNALVEKVILVLVGAVISYLLTNAGL